MVIERRLTSHIRELAKYYPVISLTGPRQAGKTTLLSQMFPDYRYVSLEEPVVREEARADPRAFLAEYDYRVIFDEAQRVPELFFRKESAAIFPGRQHKVGPLWEQSSDSVGFKAGQRQKGTAPLKG